MNQQQPPQWNQPAPGQPAPPAPSGLPHYTGPAQDPGHAYAYGALQGPVPQRMPGSVRGAQIVLWVLSGLGVLGIFAAGALGGARLAGAVTFGYLFYFISAGFAFRFGTAGNGARVTCIVLMSVQILFGLGTIARGGAGALLGIGCAIAVVVLLSQGSAGAWFKRPRTPFPPQYQQYPQ